VRVRRGISNTILGTVVVVLLITNAIGFSLYLTKPSNVQTMTDNMTETMTQTSTEVMTRTGNTSMAMEFTPANGQMIHTAWLLVEPSGVGSYALSIHAEGLENTLSTGSDYIVEGAQSSGNMAVVPIGPNATASEFETSSTGVGNFFILLDQNPYTSFENIQIAYLPGMQMTNATVVATATLSMASH
jgi:hypothetical protein